MMVIVVAGGTSQLDAGWIVVVRSILYLFIAFSPSFVVICYIYMKRKLLLNMDFIIFNIFIENKLYTSYLYSFVLNKNLLMLVKQNNDAPIKSFMD